MTSARYVLQPFQCLVPCDLQVCAHNWHTLPLSVPAGVATYLPSCLEEGSSAGVLGLLQSLGSVECLDCNKALSLYAGSTLLGFPGAAMVVVTNQEAAERVRQAHQQAGVNNRYVHSLTYCSKKHIAVDGQRFAEHHAM